MFVDAYEWVMVPNVKGMSQYADGGRVATKPYISGGAHLQKMASWWPSAAAARDSAFTTAYWKFLDEHEDQLAGNPPRDAARADAQEAGSGRIGVA